jgi:hypothetical protein
MLNFALGKPRPYWIAVPALILLGLVLLVIYLVKTTASRPYSPVKTFDGPSTSLKQTIIVPTLDTPLPEGKSAIWCASFQLAWDRLKNDVAKGPVKMENAQAVADRLRSKPFFVMWVANAELMQAW